MKPTDLLQLLREFYREKSAMRQRHVAGARLVGQYDVNNTYQYIINREDVQLTWIRDAIAELGGTPEDAPEPQIDEQGKGRRGLRCCVKIAMPAQAFVDRWRPRIGDDDQRAQQDDAARLSSAKRSSRSASSSRRWPAARICSAAAPTAPARPDR